MFTAKTQPSGIIPAPSPIILPSQPKIVDTTSTSWFRSSDNQINARIYDPTKSQPPGVYIDPTIAMNNIPKIPDPIRYEKGLPVYDGNHDYFRITGKTTTDSFIVTNPTNTVNSSNTRLESSTTSNVNTNSYSDAYAHPNLINNNTKLQTVVNSTTPLIVTELPTKNKDFTITPVNTVTTTSNVNPSSTSMPPLNTLVSSTSNQNPTLQKPPEINPDIIKYIGLAVVILVILNR